MFGEDYDDPFQGMEPIFGLESSGTEDVSPENNEAEEIEEAQEILREDYEKKKTELLKKSSHLASPLPLWTTCQGVRKRKASRAQRKKSVWRAPKPLHLLKFQKLIKMLLLLLP